MATCVPKQADDDFTTEGPALDALVETKVAEADANPAPSIPTTDVFEGLRARPLERATRGN